MTKTRTTVEGAKGEAGPSPQQRLEAIRQAQAEEGQAMHDAAREAAKAEKAKLNRLTCRTDAPAWYATQVGRTVELRRTGTDEVLATVHPPAAWGDDWNWNLIDGGVLVEPAGKDEVATKDACPKCGERNVDKLVWQDDGETVRCTTCGKQYTPPAK